MKATVSALPLESDLPPSIQDDNDLSFYNFVKETDVIKEGYKPLSPQNTNNQYFENETVMHPRDSDSVKIVPKIILRRVSNESNYFEIQTSKRKKKKKKRKHSKRKSPIRSGTLQPTETVWISDDEVILCSDNEINNNEVYIENDVQVYLGKSTEVHSDIDIQLNYLNGIYLEFKAVETLIMELAETLYLIISAQKDRLQRQLKCVNLSPELIGKEKCLAEMGFEKVVIDCGPQFTKCFKRLEENLPCLQENPSSAYLHILQEIFEAVRKIDETVQATMEEVRILVVSILRENSHKSKVFDFLTDDHKFLSAVIF
uniref:Uncharacterized protein n=1 Tax=Cuerna arida TaxID=1464854 RepID=A0A1B6G5S5_9HEMI